MKPQLFLIFFLQVLSLFPQEGVVKGRIIEIYSNDPVPEVKVQIAGSFFSSNTNKEGRFFISDRALPQGEQVLMVYKDGYVPQRIPITIQEGQTINIDPLLLELDLAQIESDIGIISLSDNQLDEDEDTSHTISGLLYATKDAFLNAAAFDFSATFFRPRGLDNANGKVLINGVEMNKFLTGRPQWSNWGGLNDLQRNREFTMGLKPNDHNFGDIAGTTNMVMRASQYKTGGRISYALANRSYSGRVMGSYRSGITKSGWTYAFLASRRFAEEGYIEGTFYDANSFFMAVEKRLNTTHSANLAAFYTPNRRGRSTAITQEVKDLKGIRYNPHWGIQNGKIRSSRERQIEEPMIILSHFWEISAHTTINTNVSYQTGTVGNTRLDNAGNRNPAANYYQRLPSYFLRFDDLTPYNYQQAYLAQQEFIRDGQLDWGDLYTINRNTRDSLSVFAIQEDRTDDTQVSLNSILNTQFSERLRFNGTLSYSTLTSANYALLKDLLGGVGYKDIDAFGDDPTQSQSDLQHPNRIVQTGDHYKYNYELYASRFNAFAQVQYKSRRLESFLGLKAAMTFYQRNGIYQNGYFPEDKRSLGRSEEVSFSNYGIKAGVLYKLSGRHIIELNAGYFTKPPVLRNVFANVRQNNDIISNLVSERIQSASLSYSLRFPFLRSRFTAYGTRFQDQTEIGFFFTQNALGNRESNAFVQEIVTGIQKQNTGVEFGFEAQLLPTFKLKGAAAVGLYIYTANPLLYLASDDFDDPNTPEVEGNDLYSLGKRDVFLKNYHISGGPERAFQLGLEYSDPEFWWVGITTNYFSNAYADVSNLRRTADFYTDADGLPFPEYETETAKELLRQEEFDPYFLVNLVGGKSWRVKTYFIGFFASINNLLNTEYKTGGFEDSRRASYRQQLEEHNRKHGPLFGNRYFFGNGTTYYFNVYIRF
jgi:hypothetical protein